MPNVHNLYISSEIFFHKKKKKNETYLVWLYYSLHAAAFKIRAHFDL
jgi:hypothetical protein